MNRDPLLKYVELARLHATPNDGTKDWMRRVNLAADQMRAIATTQLSGSILQSQRFASLLDSAGDSAALWAAHHLLELGADIEDAVVTKALAVIETAAMGGSAGAMGERMWLLNWKQRGQGAPK